MDYHPITGFELLDCVVCFQLLSIAVIDNEIQTHVVFLKGNYQCVSKEV